MSLRNKVIRLAHEKPELRKHLLPLLKSAAEKYDWEVSGYPTTSNKGVVLKYRGTERQFIKWYLAEDLDDKLDDIQIENYDTKSKALLDEWYVERNRLYKAE